MKIKTSYIDQVQLLEWYRMSDHGDTRYKRMLWTADKYFEHETDNGADGVKRIHVYLALDYLLN